MVPDVRFGLMLIWLHATVEEIKERALQRYNKVRVSAKCTVMRF